MSDLHGPDFEDIVIQSNFLSYIEHIEETGEPPDTEGCSGAGCIIFLVIAVILFILF